MAKTRRSRKSSPRRHGWTFVLLVALTVIGAVLYAYREPIGGYAGAGTAYSARVACSCHFVAGRPMDDCAKDKLAGMELVMLSADADAKSVTASIPLVKSETAAYREGYGCVLQEWQG